jgi:hypothetical protein
MTPSGPPWVSRSNLPIAIRAWDYGDYGGITVTPY